MAQPTPGQPSNMAQVLGALSQEQPYSTFVRPESLRNMPHIDDAQKSRYAQGIRNMWQVLGTNPKGSNPHETAKQKLDEATRKLRAGEQAWREEKAAKQQQSAQGQLPGQQPTASAPAAASGTAVQPQDRMPNQATQPQARPAAQPTQEMINFVQSQTYYLPPELQAGSPQAEKWLKECKTNYLHALAQHDLAKNRLRQLGELEESRKAAGQDLPPSFADNKLKTEKAFLNSRKFVEDFKQRQELYKKNREKLLKESGQSAQAASNVKPGTSNDTQQLQQDTKPAQMPQSGVMPQVQQGGGSSGSPQSAGPRPVNPNAAPGSQPQSATQKQFPDPRSQQQSQPQSATNASFAASGTGPFKHPSQQIQMAGQSTTPKMPISKTLNVTAPQPLHIGSARPSLTAPNGGPMGVAGQPVVGKIPQASGLDGESGHLLSKNKLYELVRQVTGGEGPDEDLLSPEVEELIINYADDFVDDVITQSAKLAKSREHNVLEIRDIQHVLERNFNIRIPGYASDEVRTVRKFNPAPGWTQKMNAVTASKVMNGKGDL